ncbi:MAG: SAM-dependent methyltransferase [Myxococcota bacterium]
MKLFTSLLFILLGACASGSHTTIDATHDPVVASPTVDAVRAAVDAPDRSDADRALDEGRKPYELLTLFGVKPGMHVVELAAGGGYTAELLARIVGPTGSVIGMNSPFILQKFAEKPWSERLTKPIMANVTRWDGNFETPFPPGTKDLDLVVNHLFYHDTVWLGTDRAAMNRAIFDGLRSGGVYAVVDHSALAGHGVADAQTLHRIEEDVVVKEVTAAGFVLAKRSDLLRHAADTRDWSTSPSAAGEKRGTSDRFILLFAKP